MNIITRALSVIGIERRAVDPSWKGAALLRSGGTSPGAAESLSTVYACVAAISETLASLPLVLYRRTPDDGRERAPEHPLYSILHDQPNGQQTALEFREMMQAGVLLRGNAHAEIVRGYDGQVTALIPIPGDRITTLYLDNGRLAFDVSDRLGNVRRLLQDEVLHLRHRSSDGLIGVSPITASRETVQLALAERDHGNSTFTNGAKLSGVLKFPQKLKSDQRAALSNSWSSQYAGGGNAGKTAILEEGVDYQTISMSNADSEYLASRQFSVAEICRLFRVPPTLAGDMGHSNYSNTQELSRQFITLTLKRHLVMWEQAISRALLSPEARQVFFAEHNLDGLLRGDSVNRADFYSKGIADGWLMVDEVRHLENLPKLPNATSNQAAQASTTNAQAGPDQMPGARPVPQVGGVAQVAQVGT